MITLFRDETHRMLPKLPELSLSLSVSARQCSYIDCHEQSDSIHR